MEDLLERVRRKGIEIIEGSINKENYYSVKESAELLKVTTKTIRNRIESKSIKAFFHYAGVGQSQYLIPKNEINLAINSVDVVSFSRSISLPDLISNIRKEMQIENEQLKLKVNELIELQIESNKKIEELQELIKTSHDVQENKKPWYKRLFA